MAKTGYRNRLLKETESLSEEKLRVLADFAAYLKEREEWEATAEILGNKQMARQIRQSRKAWAEGNKKEFVSLNELKAKLNA
jgi:hypothetical protein